MGMFDKLFSRNADPREELRPLWHRVVEISREETFYRDLGVADTVEGRFDMITLVLSLVLLRLEAEPGREAEVTLLSELFVADMDGQLREQGVGDVVVGKHVGKLMSTLGGRWGALRDAFATEDHAALVGAVQRNVHLTDETLPEGLAGALRHLRAQLFSLQTEPILAGSIPR